MAKPTSAKDLVENMELDNSAGEDLFLPESTDLDKNTQVESPHMQYVQTVIPTYMQKLKAAKNDVKERLRIVDEFISEVMVQGEDYGVIPGIPKPTLFKSGAEKLSALFDVVCTHKIVGKSFYPDRATVIKKKNYNGNYQDLQLIGLFVYEVEGTLLDRETNSVMGGGVGGGNSFEKKFAAQGDCFQTQNTVLKMSKKRAAVDSLLSLSLVSGRFTQDAEDLDRESLSSGHEQVPSSTTSRTTQSSPSVDGYDPELKFGKEKGKKLSEIFDVDNLLWYISKAEEGTRDTSAQYYNLNLKSLKAYLIHLKKLCNDNISAYPMYEKLAKDLGV